MSRLEKLKAFMEKQKLMTLATSDHRVWSANVYFVYDENLCVYFISSKHALHSLHVKSNPWVSFGTAWFDEKAPMENRKGIQGAGVCGELTDEKEIVDALELFKKTFPMYKRKPSEFIGDEDEYRLYKIHPDMIKYFDDKAFGTNGFEEFNFMKNVESHGGVM